MATFDPSKCRAATSLIIDLGQQDQRSEFRPQFSQRPAFTTLK